MVLTSVNSLDYLLHLTSPLALITFWIQKLSLYSILSFPKKLQYIENYSIFPTQVYQSIIMPRGVLKENLPLKICVSCNRPFNWRKKWERCWDEVITCSKSCNAKRRQSARSRPVNEMPYAGEYDDSEGKVGVGYNDDSHSIFLMAIANGDGTMKSNESVPLEVNNDKKSSSSSCSTTKQVSESRKEADSISDEESAEPEQLAEGVIDLDLDDDYEEELDAGNTKKHATGTAIVTDSAKTRVEVIYPEGSREWRKAQRKADKLERRVQREREDSDLDADNGKKTCDVCTKRVDLLIRCTVDASREWKMVCRKCWDGVSGGVTDGDAQHPHYTYGGLWKNRRAK